MSVIERAGNVEAVLTYTMNGRGRHYGSYLVNIKVREAALRERGATDLRIRIDGRVYPAENVRAVAAR